MALIVQAADLLWLGRREQMEAAVTQASALAPDDLDVQGAVSEVWGEFWILQEERERARLHARQRLRADSIGAQLSVRRSQRHLSPVCPAGESTRRLATE